MVNNEEERCPKCGGEFTYRCTPISSKLIAKVCERCGYRVELK